MIKKVLFLFLFLSCLALTNIFVFAQKPHVEAYRGIESYRKGDYQKATESLGQALAGSVSKKQILEWAPVLGRSYEAIKNYQKALSAYNRAYELKPKDTDRMLDLARVYALVDLDEKAIGLYLKVLKREKDRKDVVLALATLYVKSGQFEKARQRVDDYIQREPQDSYALGLLSKIDEESGYLRESAQRREILLSRNPSPEGYFELGKLWAKQNEFDLTRLAFRKAKKLGLNSAEFYLQKGIVAWQRKNWKAASGLLETAIEKDSNSEVARFFIALNEFDDGNIKKAARVLKGMNTKLESAYIKELSKIFASAIESHKAGK